MKPCAERVPVPGPLRNAAVNGEATTFLSPELLQTMYFSSFRYVIIFAPLAIVFMFGAAINRLSENAARGIFVLFASLIGVSMATIFARYTGGSIAQTFFVTAIAFLSLSLWGYTTKKDISGWGSFLIMGVVGLIIASIDTEHQEHIYCDGFKRSVRVVGQSSNHGCFEPLSGLLEHVPVLADVHGRPRVSPLTSYNSKVRLHEPGFFYGRSRSINTLGNCMVSLTGYCGVSRKMPDVSRTEHHLASWP